jgi:hypothetical protein
VTLKGERIAEDFQRRVEAYVKRTYGPDSATTNRPGAAPDATAAGWRGESVIPIKVVG